MILKIGNLYVKFFSISEYDTEIELKFTNQIEEAKKFEQGIFIDLIKSLLNIENIEIIGLEEKEEENE